MSTDPREFEHPIDGTGGNVNPEAIEAAARALFDLTPAENLAYATIPRWVDLHEQDRIYYRRLATAALTAAYPLIEASAKAEALREAAESFQGVMIGIGGRDPRTSGAAWLRARAELIERKGS